ncbi:MAG: alpha/beta family hydrolase [Lamprobacter sp.]|uniref:alpha/beta family hydrolase n=1 Tax=Lamprobacter sp. TaxID=3100796 RepID=UPI002B260E8D|nr:alpha/beta family hydrolase [Lamprobacter sp.]MEA3642502.1 alpha/beta family hydrolase [Lamprobacter sp.]
MSDNPENAHDVLTDGPPDARWTLILAHGAGQGMDAPFMAHIARALGRAGLRVIRFEFPYMTEIQRTGRRTSPNREPVLLERWTRIIDQALGAGTDAQRLLIGGKSLGGRMASLIADERAAGLVCLGYPFHPAGKPDRLRTEHLRLLRSPTLICQGTRDPFGTPDEVAGYALAPSIRLTWIEDGDHSFKPRRQSGRTWMQNLDQAAGAVLGFVATL